MEPAAVKQAALEQLDGAFNGELIGPEDPTYDEARKVFNAMIDRRPGVIARCTSERDVIAALRFARANELVVAVRGGGHSAPGFSVCDDGIVIDLTPMKRIEVNPAAKSAVVQPGVVWGELDAATQQHGLAVTGGRVSDTGVAGLTLGSGSGWLERKIGLTADSLLSAEVVTADGRVLWTNSGDHPELFWGLRGGGGNFGVVTKFHFRLHEVGPVLVAGMLLHRRERASELIAFYRDFMEQAPEEVGGGLALITAPDEDFVPEALRGQPAAGIIVCYVGPVEEGTEAIRPLKEFGPPEFEMVGPIPYRALQSMLDPGSPPGAHDYYKIDFLRELSDEAVETLVDKAADVQSPLTQVILEPLGGALARRDQDATALSTPAVGWAYHALSLWMDCGDSDRNVAWTRELADAMRPFATEGNLPNFLTGDDGEAKLRASYGDEKYERLVALKDEYDPENVFCMNQNIKPSGKRGG